jgi:glucose-6-phosphate 1-dehydrogenase
MSSPAVVRPSARPGSQPSPFVPGAIKPDPFSLVIFGATGDLAARKLLPALFRLYHHGFLPEDFCIVGLGRRDKGDEGFRAEVRQAFEKFAKDLPCQGQPCQDFLARVYYERVDVTRAEDFKRLAARVQKLETDRKLPGNRLCYVATDPGFFAGIVEGSVAAGLLRRNMTGPWGRVVIEKPFGHDLESALELDQHILQSLGRDQIYRIDHYLGKETVQNLLAFRFGNAIFEPLFGRQHVEHVQITTAESIGIEGGRGSYFDSAGAMRDMVQNHLLQLLALVTMDAPATLKARDIGDAKLKVFNSLVPFSETDMERSIVHGQYGPGTMDGQPVKGYREEEGVAKDSSTESYVALRLHVETWRWAGVPFLLRTGKRLPRRVTEIAVQFHEAPLRLFKTVECVGDFCDLAELKPNVLLFRIQPDEGISLSFSAKRPGMQMVLQPVHFDFEYDKSFDGTLPEAYERLLLDALRGDPTLFTRSDQLEAAWQFVTPILRYWEKHPPRFPNYKAGTWGPIEAERLAEGITGGWRRPGM